MLNCKESNKCSAGGKSDKEVMYMQQEIMLGCGLLKNVRKCKGSVTYCILGVLRVGEVNVALTYDCHTDNLVIHDWFKVPLALIPEIKEEVGTYFGTIK